MAAPAAAGAGLASWFYLGKVVFPYGLCLVDPEYTIQEALRVGLEVTDFGIVECRLVWGTALSVRWVMTTPAVGFRPPTSSTAFSKEKAQKISHFSDTKN